jgi:O-antigen ligase
MAQFSFFNWAAAGFSFFNIGSGGGPGWFQNSGEFGIQMCIFLSLSAYFFLALHTNWPQWKKLFFFLFPLTAMSGTISSSSRGALLGAGAVLCIMLIKSNHKFKGLVALVVIATLVYSFIPEQQLDRFHSAGEDSTSLYRMQMWVRGLDLLSRFPVLGVGLNNWTVANHTIYGIDSLLCHNIFIECASELGYIGLMTFLLMIMFTFINNYQTRKHVLQHVGESRFIFYMAHGLDCALIGYLVSGFFVTVLYYPFFWINIAMTVALNNIARNISQ